MNASLALDILIAGLLVVTIGYSGVLYRRLAHLRRSNSEMNRLVRKFSHSIERAQLGLLSLKSTGAELSSTLQERTDAARLAGDDLGILTDAGNHLADRLDGLVSEGRTRARTGGHQGSQKLAQEGRGAEPRVRPTEMARSETELELAEALREAG